MRTSIPAAQLVPASGADRAESFSYGVFLMSQVKVVHVPGWLAWLIAIPVLVVAAFFGFVVLVAVLGLILLMALYLGIRIWWLRRKAERTPESGVIEGEYVVVRKTQKSDTEHLR